MINSNPRAPRGARRSRCAGDRRKFGISIHAPREGRDLLVPASLLSDVISIHAPREGRDVSITDWLRG